MIAVMEEDVLTEVTNQGLGAVEEGETSMPPEADMAELQARIRQLEMQQRLMDSELESMSDLAKQSDAQLRSYIRAAISSHKCL